DVGGGAADPAGAGTGVDMVRLYLDNRMESSGILLGDAAYGHPRLDVAAALGGAAFTNSGFDYMWTPSSVSTGQHTLYIYAHSLVSGWSYKTLGVTVQAQATATPRPSSRPYGPGQGAYGPYGPGAPG